MAYNLKWPGLHDLDIYIIDNETKNIYGKKKQLPDRLNAINTLEHKYVRLIDVVSLFPNSMKVRVLNLVETLTSISSLKPLYKDKVSELRFLHLSSLLAFILVYPFCKPFQKTRDAILRFLMDYTETVCMDCGFIQRECQCHVFSSLDDEAGGSDEITEVVCKVSEWKSTGTQTDPSSTTVDPNPTKVIVPLPTNFKLKTSEGQVVAKAASSGTSSVISGTMPPIIPQTLIQGPPMYTIPTVTSFPTSFNPLQQMSNMSCNFLGGSTGVPVGSISSAAPNPTLNITPSILPMTPQTMQPAHDPVSGSGFKMGNNFVYIPPEVLNSENPAHSSEKQDTGKRKNLFRLDPETRLFVSDDFSLDPKTGKVTKNVDTKKEVEGSSETNSSKRRSKKKKQILIGAAKEFATEGRNLSDDLVSKRKKKKRKTVKVLLEKEGKEEKSSGEKKETSDLPEKSGTETASEAVHQEDNESSELTREEVGDNLVKKDIELDANVTAIENEKRNTDKEPEDSCSKVSSESKTTTETDNTVQPEADGEDRKTTEQQTKKVIQDKQTNGLNEHPDSERDTDEGTDGTESSSEGEDSKSESMSEEDVRIHGGVQYKVISANPISKGNAKPPQLKVKMPFAGKMKSIPIKVKLPQRDPAKSVEASSAPGSILSKCNFSYASSPITGQPVLQQVKKKLKQLNTSDSISGKSNATSKDKACFSVIPAHNSTDTVKGYAKFEFAQTGEKMLRCIIYTCGQVFDTEQFAEIHHTLHQHGTPKELRCKLCNFKGHVLKWYDMLRHLKHTHGSVINPKILPPKRKKPDEKQSNEEKKSTGKEDGAKKSEKENEGERSTSREANAVVKEDDGTERSNDLQKSSPIKEQNNLENSSVNLSNSSVGKAPDETSILKSDGLSALADVCDQLEPMDTSDSSKETTEVSKLNGDSSVSKTESLLDTEESATKKEEKKFDTAVEGQDKAGKVESIPVSNGGGLSSPVKVEENPEAGKAESEMSKDDKEGATNTTSLKIDGEEHGCDLCGIKFENKKELDTHSTFHYYNKYKCIHCGGIMYTWGHLQRHLKECTDVEKGRVFYNCQYCHLSFRDRKSHYIHSISHGDPGLVCSYCDDDKSWDNWTALKKHYKVFHMAMRLLSAFKCDHCNREFNTAKQYNNHMQDHKRRKERAAKMNKADQKEIDDMKDMEIQVTKDGLVKCPDCEQTFKNNHYMEMHHKFKHGEEISCPKCNYVAKSKLMLKIHMGKAHIEKSHKCGECGKTFAHYHQYKVHLSTHAQKTTFSCKFCQAGYPTNGELRQHMFKEHKLPAHKKLIQCEDCDFKCFSRTTLKAHSRKNHPETTVVEDGEDHCYFNKKEPSPPPKVVKKTKDKPKNQESFEKMLETKSKYFIMRHNTCCRTRSFEQNMEIKNRKVAAEKRLFEGPKKRGRKPKSVTETTVVTEDPEVAEKKDPTWSPKKVEDLAADPNVQMGATEKTNRRASCTATPTDDFSQEDIHKIHENRAPNKRRSAPPKRYSPEREIVQVKKRAKSPPIRRPRSPKEKRRPSKSPVYKKRRSFPGTDYDSSLGYLEQQNPLLSSTPYESAQRIKERRRSAKQYEKRLKHEKPTLYAELMHVKKLKSVPMVVDQSASLSVPLLDHCYCRESKPIEQYRGDISNHNPDLNIVTTPEVADFEECLTDDVEIPSPLGAYNRPVYSSDTMTTQHSRRGRGRGRPFGRGPGRVTERKQQPVAMRAVLSGGSVSTLQLTNNSGQFSKLSSHLSDDFGSGVNVRIAGRNTNMTPSTVSQVRTVMASPSDDSMELDSDSLLPPGVDMQDDILKVAADMFIGESEISEEITEASDSEHHISSSSVGESSPYTMTNTIPKYPKPIVIRRPAYEQTASFSRNRVVTISQHGVTEHLQSRVVAEAIPQLSAEPQSVVTENIPQYSAEDGEATLETVHLDSDEIIAETSHITNAEAYLEGGTMPGHLAQSENVTLSQTGGSNIVPVTAAEDFHNVESEPVIANEMAQELVQAILEHSRTSDTELDDIHLNEVDYNILLGSRGGISGSSTTVNNENTIQTTNDCTEQRTRSVDHQYF